MDISLQCGFKAHGAPFYTIVQKRCCALGFTFCLFLFFSSKYQQRVKTTCLWCRTGPVCLQQYSCCTYYSDGLDACLAVVTRNSLGSWQPCPDRSSLLVLTQIKRQPSVFTTWTAFSSTRSICWKMSAAVQRWVAR